MLFCAKHYDNSGYISTEEFIEDLNRIKYIKKLITRYVEHGDLKERLIINHLQVIYNLFGVEPSTRMLFLALKKHHDCLKPFLVLFNTMPEIVFNIEGKDIRNSDVSMDNNIVEVLRKI